MREFNPKKVFVQYRDKMEPYEPVMGRKYTITHSDLTAELFVFIASDYAVDQLTDIRDDVQIGWEQNENGLFLKGSVLVDGTGVRKNIALRNKIFYDEMPLALKALREADRFLFSKYPQLDDAPVLIHFISNNPTYNKLYNFGPIGNYK